MTITALPEAPSTADPANFASEADAFVAALATFVTEANATATAVNTNASTASTAATTASANATTAQAVATAVLAASNYIGTSAASLSVGSGSKALTSVSGASAIVTGDDVTAFSRSNNNNRIRGTATVSGATITLTVAADGYSGSGTVTDWIIVSSWFAALLAATSSDIWTATSSAMAITPKGLKDASAFQSLTPGASIAWNTALGFNAKVTLGSASNAMAAPSGLIDGFTYTLFLTQDGTGNRTVSSWDSTFDWGAAGTPILSTGASKVDMAFGIYSSTTGKLHMSFRRAA